MTAQRILFVDLWRLGDAVAATAGLRALRAARPDAEIGVVAHPTTGEPLFRSADADHRIAFDAFWTRGKTPLDKYLPWTIDAGAVARTARAVHAFRPDACLLFRGDPREQAFFAAAGCRAISDFRVYAVGVPGVRTVPLPLRVPRYREYVDHIVAWSGTAVDATPVINGVTIPRPSARDGILIHPGSSWRYKQWHRDHVVALARTLVDRGCAVTLIGTGADRPFIQSVEHALGEDRVATVYPTTLDELYARIASAAAIVCNNSAPLHIAEALDTPCVAITGSSDPVRWGTYRPHSRTLCRGIGLACHPCKERRCVRPAHPCVDDVSVADVVAALDAIAAPVAIARHAVR